MKYLFQMENNNSNDINNIIVKRNLPHFVTIKKVFNNVSGESCMQIHSQGFIPKNTFIGITHIKMKVSENNYVFVETTLGSSCRCNNYNSNALILPYSEEPKYIPGMILELDKLNKIHNNTMCIKYLVTKELIPPNTEISYE